MANGRLNLAFSPKYLFYTNISLSTFLAGVGDLIEQTYEKAVNHLKAYNLTRASRMACSGTTSGIISHNWYKFIDKVIKGRTFDQAMKKLVLDTFVGSPMLVMSFFATVALFEDDPWENFNDEVKDKFWTLYKAELIIWPPAQLINFYFTPLRFRVLYDNSVSLGLDVYTSYVKHMYKSPASEKEEAIEETKTKNESE